MMTRKKIVELIEEIQMAFNLHDIWRVKNPKKKVLHGPKSLPLSSAD